MQVRHDATDGRDGLESFAGRLYRVAGGGEKYSREEKDRATLRCLTSRAVVTLCANVERWKITCHTASPPFCS